MYYIRELEESDYQLGFLSLLGQLNSYEYKLSFSEFRDIFNRITSQKSKFFVLLIEEKLVGTLKVIEETKFSDNVLHIEDVVIDKDYRGRKFGSILVKYVIKLYQSSNINLNNKFYKIVLSCNPDKVGFYQNCKFINKGNEMCYYFKKLN